MHEVMLADGVSSLDPTSNGPLNFQAFKGQGEISSQSRERWETCALPRPLHCTALHFTSISLTLIHAHLSAAEPPSRPHIRPFFVEPTQPYPISDLSFVSIVPSKNIANVLPLALILCGGFSHYPV